MRKKSKLAAHDHFSSTVLSVGTSSCYWTKGILRVARYEEKLKDTFDDEIKLAGLEAVVPRRKWYSTRTAANVCGSPPRYRDVRGGEDGLGNRYSKPSEAGARGHSDPTDVGTINSLASSTGRLSQVRWKQFSERLAHHAKAMARKAHRGKPWPKSVGKRAKKVREMEIQRTIQRFQECRRFVQK